jgi:prophage DNA circulation protein
MPFREGTDGTQPFDQDLSQRVQRLSERCDTSTAQAIASRKAIPSKRAALLQTRAEIQREIAQKRENKRRRLENEIEKLIKERDSQRDESIVKPLERSEEVANSLQKAKENIDQLAVALVEQTSAANEQAKFVQRLRIMSASYTS